MDCINSSFLYFQAFLVTSLSHLQLDNLHYMRGLRFISFYVQPPQTFFQVVLVVQLLCWTGQFIGHGFFEVTNFVVHGMVNDLLYLYTPKINCVLQKRAPALLDNLVQAFIMAPFFVLLEVFFLM